MLLCSAATTGTASEAVHGKEVYGADDRQDLYEVTSPEILSAAKAVCAFIPLTYLLERENGFYELDLFVAAGGAETLCADEAFSAQPQISYCTGFLVGSDVIATAGHCVLYEGQIDDFSAYRIVFGYQMEDAENVSLMLSPEQVYSVVAVEEVRYSAFTDLDFAVLRLDREVSLPGVAPLALRDSGQIGMGEPVGIIGHPLGLPLKVAYGDDTVMDRSAFGYPNSFITNFDASAGSSGSPVFNQATGLVEGIYVFSFVDDLVYEDDCARMNTVGIDEGGQGVLKTSSFRRYVAAANGLPVEGKAPACAAGADGMPGTPLGADLLVAALTALVLALGRPARSRPLRRVRR